MDDPQAYHHRFNPLPAPSWPGCLKQGLRDPDHQAKPYNIHINKKFLKCASPMQSGCQQQGSWDPDTNQGGSKTPQHTSVPHNMPAFQLQQHYGIPSPFQLLTPQNTPSPIKVDALIHALAGYDQEEVDFLENGFRNGFSLFSTVDNTSYVAPNAKAALDNPQAVNEKLNKELSMGRIAGPYPVKPCLNFKGSPLNIRSKKQSNGYRLLHDLSYPYSEEVQSVNEGIDQSHATVQYDTLQQAVDLICQCKSEHGQCFMAKTDIKNAYRNLPIAPQEYPLVGFTWQNQFYMDKCLPMGCRSSCKTFNRFSSALKWVLVNKLKLEGAAVHILDDFFIICPSPGAAHRGLHDFINFCEDIGVPIAFEKTEAPNTIMTFMGVTLDSIQLVAYLPQEKVTDALEKIKEATLASRKPLKEVQSLIGTLNFAASVIRPARAFSRRLIDVTRGVKKSFHSVRISKGVKKDLLVWRNFLQDYNCKSFMLYRELKATLNCPLVTDAAGGVACGGYFGVHWFIAEWPASWKNSSKYHITFLELFPIFLGLHLFAGNMQNNIIDVKSDNMATVYALNKLSSTDTNVMVLIRKIVFLCLKYNILIKAHHIQGHVNKAADFISRKQICKFKKLIKLADPYPTPIPDNLQPSNFTRWQED